jgi:hypothetical protein
MASVLDPLSPNFVSPIPDPIASLKLLIPSFSLPLFFARFFLFFASPGCVYLPSSTPWFRGPLDAYTPIHVALLFTLSRTTATDFVTFVSQLLFPSLHPRAFLFHRLSALDVRASCHGLTPVIIHRSSVVFSRFPACYPFTPWNMNSSSLYLPLQIRLFPCRLFPLLIPFPDLLSPLLRP